MKLLCNQGQGKMSAPPPIRDLQIDPFEMAAIGMCLLDDDARVLRCNRALGEMLGYSAQELLRLTGSVLSPADEHGPDAEHRARLVAGSSASFEREQRFLHRDGHIVWGKVLCLLAPADGGGQPIFFYQIQDLSRLKEIEAALQSSQETSHSARQRLREQNELLDQSRDAIIVHGLDGALLYWNKGAERMFGFTREQAIGQTFQSLMGAGAALPEPAHAELLATGEWIGELECLAAQGHTLVVERRCTVVPAGNGEASAILTVNTDVSERRRAEKEIVLLNNVLEQRIRKRTAELEESNEDLRDFAYSLAHDLRAPLASIDGFSAQLEFLLASQLDEKSRHYLGRVRAGVKTMADLTDALLALADLSNTQLLHQNVDLSSLARGIIERLNEQAPDRDVSVLVEDTPRAQGDVRLLTDVLENLLGNAWKFTSKTPGAEIVFGGESWPNGSYLYHVKDNGAGFDPTYSYKLFGPFQRLHTSAEFEGTGIGLAMVRKIVSRHGGRVWAESMPGEGASFYFTLNENSARHEAREHASRLAEAGS
jgi:PAS domain S-box-containing protein